MAAQSLPATVQSGAGGQTSDELAKAAIRPLQKNFRLLLADVDAMACIDRLFSEEVIDFDLLEQVQAKHETHGQREATRLLMMSLLRMAQREKTCRVARELHEALIDAGDAMKHVASVLGKSLEEAEAEVKRVRGGNSGKVT